MYLNVRKYNLSNRAVDVWNGLDPSIIDSDTTNTFKQPG